MPTITIKKGKEEISSFEIDTTISIGRGGDADIQLDDATASTNHAIIDKEDGEFILKDLGSTNGTFLNKKKVTESELKSGDIIMIGRHFLFFD